MGPRAPGADGARDSAAGATDAARWARVEQLFFQALEREPSARAAFLTDACAGDGALLREVESLLAAHEGGGAVADLSDEAVTAPAPDRVGPYRVIRPLGQGGMGAVYLAEREGGDFTQRVALKLIAAGWLDPHLEERLRTERRILARLEHPSIARLIDGGVTADGRPFFAMEYVQGVNVLEYCEANALPVRDRLRLFVDICDAVQHAHQQLVVHRDLKPGNILVTAEGRPKLLDFGIAKLLESPDTGADATRTSLWVTPAYASPEQVRGAVIGTLSDVYALGVLLYELLAGRRPYETDGRSPAEIERIVCERMPDPPSRAAPERVRRHLDGDLDTIVLKALAKEPARRYASVEQLAEDVRRYLAGRTVLARPDRWTYRARKFVRRHRAGVLAAAAVVLSLAGGLAAAVTQARRADAQRARAESEAARATRVASMMVDIFRLSDPTRTLGDTITAREMLDRGAARIERELSDEPDLQAELLGEVASVYANLGLLDRAEELARRALALSEQAFGERSLETSARHAQLGGILATRGERAAAIASLRRGMDIREAGVTGPDSILAVAWSDLAWQLREERQHEEAADLFARSLAAQQSLFGESGTPLAATVLGLAASYHDAGRFDDAEALFQSVIDRRDASAARPHPLAASALVNLGVLRRLRGQYAAAEPLLRSGVAMRRALYDADHPDVLEGTLQWARALHDLGRLDEAAALLEEGQARASAKLGADHPTTNSLRETAATVILERGDAARAAAMFDTAVAVKKARFPTGHAEIVAVLIRSAEPLVEAGRLERAHARYAEALALTGETSVYRVVALQGLAGVAWRQDRRADAQRLYDDALALATGGAGLAAAHRYVRALRRDRAALLIDQGRPAEAEQELRAVDAVEDTIYPGPHHYRGRTLARLGEAQLARGDMASAERSLRSALEHLRTLPPTHWRAGEARALLGAAAAAQGRTGEGGRLQAEGLAAVRSHAGPAAFETRRLEARLQLLRDASTRRRGG